METLIEVARRGEPGMVLQFFRKKSSWGMEELARKTGWQREQIWRYETGKTGISTHHIETFAQAIGKPPELLAMAILGSCFSELIATDSEVGKLFQRALTLLENS